MRTQELKDAVSALTPFLDGKGLVAAYTVLNFQDTYVQATDGRMLMRFNFTESSGISCNVEAAAFTSLIRSINAEDTTLTLVDGKLKVKAKRVSAEFVLPSSVVYPELKFEPAAWDPVTADYLKALFLARMSVCPDQTAGPLTGVYVQGNFDEVNVLSCDRYRLSWVSAKNPFDQEAYILHVDFIDQLRRYASQVEFMSLHEGMVYAQLKDKRAVLACNLLPGDFPGEQMLTHLKSAGASATANRMSVSKEMRDQITVAVKRQGIVQEQLLEFDRTTQVTLKPKEGVLVLYSVDASVGSVEEAIELAASVANTDKEFSFSVNPGFLVEAFASVDWMSFDPATNTCCFGTDKFTHLVKTKMTPVKE